MSTNSFFMFLFLLLLFGIAPFLSAQNGDQALLPRRIFWSGGEYALRYRVEIEKQEGEVYNHYLNEFTESLFVDVYLEPGDYRFRIFTHDVIGRPDEGTDWLSFSVESVDIVQIDDLPEEAASLNRAFNTVGLSLGTSFVDPVLIISVHGTKSITGNLFAELGLDAGFISAYDDVESYFSIYPYANLGLFFPFNSRNGFFVGAGAGLMINSYSFSYGDAAFNVFAVNFAAGFNLGKFFNVSYTLRTDFATASNKLALGFVYRMSGE